ncbi:hypothetical protein GCM10008905_20250 [Clostridium malenominatum]|uniref:Uncharacterized protein n=1 Tax=Clostridium malenominatum TaxID=1539 RepID=A0ABP3UAL6_9CLOT
MLNFDIQRFISCYFKIGAVMFIILLLYDLGLFYLNIFIYDLMYNLKRKSLYHPRILIYICKFEKIIDSIIYLIRLKWISSGYIINDKRELKFYKIIQENTIKSLLNVLIRFLIFSKFSVMTLIITIIVYFKISIKSLISYQNTNIIKEGYSKIYSVLSNNLNGFLTLLPSFIIVLTIIASVHFVSLKYKYHLAVRQVNKEYLVDLAKVHKELNKCLANLVYEGARNLGRALEVVYDKPQKYAIKDMIIKDTILSISYRIEDIVDDEVIWRKNRSYSNSNLKEVIPNGFCDIDAIEEVVNILEKSKKDGYYYRLHSFSVLNRNVLKLSTYRLNNKDYLNKILLTQSGISEIIKISQEGIEFYDLKNSIPNVDDIDYYNSLILKERNDLKIDIDNNIIAGIELLIDLARYVEATNKIFNLNSKKWSDIIGQILGSNK